MDWNLRQQSGCRSSKKVLEDLEFWEEFEAVGHGYRRAEFYEMDSLRRKAIFYAVHKKRGAEVDWEDNARLYYPEPKSK